MKNGEYLLSREKVSRAYRKLAVPALITTLISQIYNLTDTYFIGLLDNTAMLSAVSVAMPFMWLVSAVCGMIGAGAPQLISLKDGAGDSAASAKCTSFAVYGTLALSIIITPIAMLLIDPALGIMSNDGAVTAHAGEYLRIITDASPVTALGGALRGVLGAKGYAQRSSIAGVAGIIANIILDPIFILVFDMGMAGAAWATALGSAVTLVISIIYIRGCAPAKPALPSGADIGLMFKISLASTVSSVITAITVGLSFSMAADFGGELVASISVCSKIYSTVVSVVSALAFSIQPFIGYNYASGDHRRLMRGMLTSLGIGQAVCIAGTAAFALCGGAFMRCFTGDAALIAAGAKMLRLMSIGLPVAALQMNCMSYLSGTGKAIPTLILSLARQILLFVPIMLVMRSLWGETGMMMAYAVTDILAAIPAALMCAPEIRRMLTAARHPAAQK